MNIIIDNNKEFEINNIFCIGLNYYDHIEEMKSNKSKDLVVFSKPTYALNDSEDIYLPNFSDNIHYETEILIVIGKNVDNKINESNYLNYVEAIGIGLDLTARDIQTTLKQNGHPWLKSKGFKNSACVSSFIDIKKIKDINNINFKLEIDGTIRQNGNTKNMIFPFYEIINNLSLIYSLEKGALIFTGTPSGVGKLEKNNRLILYLENIIKKTFIVK